MFEERPFPGEPVDVLGFNIRVASATQVPKPHVIDQNENEVLANNFVTEEKIVEESQSIEEPEVSNGLENFEIEEETPELFNSEGEDTLTNETLESKETENFEEDDLEIPAFLRRQKN